MLVLVCSLVAFRLSCQTVGLEKSGSPRSASLLIAFVIHPSVAPILLPSVLTIDSSRPPSN